MHFLYHICFLNSLMFFLNVFPLNIELFYIVVTNDLPIKRKIKLLVIE